MTRIARKDDGPFVRRVTWIGLVVNVVMMTIKFIAGVIGHSQALIADAIHSASDFATDIAVLVGSRFWNSPPDMKHPNGHRRFETLISLGIGIAGIVVGVFIAINAIEGDAVASVRHRRRVRAAFCHFQGMAFPLHPCRGPENPQPGTGGERVAPPERRTELHSRRDRRHSYLCDSELPLL